MIVLPPACHAPCEDKGMNFFQTWRVFTRKNPRHVASTTGPLSYTILQVRSGRALYCMWTGDTKQEKQELYRCYSCQAMHLCHF